ncbi:MULTISPECIES: hypothetical protein [unclassified Erythrobacter]|nr:MULTISPECIES: hypothetical protein [unclassified Erythrobacter]
MFVKKYGQQLFAAVFALAGTAFVLTMAYAPATMTVTQAVA